jgi:DNA polymerase-3 subunit delta'
MAFSHFDDLNVYQPLVAQMLLNSFQKGRLSHAYIFEGPRGTQKTEAAFLFAKRLLCHHPKPDQNPCGICPDCIRIERQIHPNVFVIQADGEQIKKEQIRKMMTEFSRTALEAGPRIYIIEDAHKLNAESSNTLLKTLEEPGLDIYALLLTDNFNSLLKTIVSRSQVMHFRPIDKALVREQLTLRGAAPAIAAVIPEYTNNLEDAMQIAASEEMMARA